MKKISILHNGGGWITNIGNAFLDFGSIGSVRQACSDAEIHSTSVLNRWISFKIHRGIYGKLFKKLSHSDNVFNLQEFSKIDFIVQSGAFLGQDWFDIHGRILFKLKDKGVKLIVNGGGMTDIAYSEKEIESTREYLKKIKPYIFISRDTKTFDSFSDLAEYSYNGIDCAFFLRDCHKPIDMDIPPYVVLNFDKEPEPPLQKLEIDSGKLIIRTHHSFWHNFPITEYPRMKRYYYELDNTMISELPYDYLNLYANSSSTYSDRVHACVATFSYGNPARLFSKSPRSHLFDRIGASEITKYILKPDTKKIEKEKQKQIAFLSEIFRGK